MGEKLDKLKGAFLGFCIGDALGMPIEGLDKQEIIRDFGSTIKEYKNPSKYCLSPNLKKGQITDDSQLLISTLESLIENKGYNIEDIAKRYISLKGRNHEEMILRAPGRSTCYGIDKIRKRIFEKKGSLLKYSECGKKNGKGSGAMARSFLLKFFKSFDYDNFHDNFRELNFITHIDNDSLSCSYSLMYCLDYLKENHITSNKDGKDMIDYLLEKEEIKSVSEISDKLKSIKNNLHKDFSFSNIGGSSPLCYDVLASGIYSFVYTPNNFKQSLINAVNQGGDSDSIGAITGLLSGYNNGASKIEKSLIKNLEVKDKIEELSYKTYEIINGL